MSEPQLEINPNEIYLKVVEVARRLRVSKMTVYRLIKNGDLFSIRIGRSFRVPETSLEDYIKDRYLEGNFK